MKFIYDFIRFWIYYGDIKEAWQDAKFKNNKKIQKELKDMTEKPKSILYRDHHKGLDESMETVQTFTELKDLEKYLKGKFGENIEKVTFKFSSHDKRIGWDTHYVLIHYKEIDINMIVGMSNGILK